MSTIVLATINARYIHSAMGLRCLAASLDGLDATIAEYTLRQSAVDIAADLIAREPTIIGLGVYIWNTRLTLDVVQLLRALAPQVTVVLGGPEVSHEPSDPLAWQPIVQQAHYTVRGEGEVAFRALCEAILAGTPPIGRMIDGVAVFFCWRASSDDGSWPAGFAALVLFCSSRLTVSA